MPNLGGFPFNDIKTWCFTPQFSIYVIGFDVREFKSTELIIIRKGNTFVREKKERLSYTREMRISFTRNFFEEFKGRELRNKDPPRP